MRRNIFEKTIAIAKIMFVIIGIGGVIAGFASRAEAQRSQTWPSTKGRIVESYLAEKVEYDEDGLQETSYAAEIKYEYAVNDQLFTSQRVTVLSDPYSSYPSGAQALLDRFPADRTVTVFYDPDDPSQALLDRTVPSIGVILGIGAVFIFLGLFGLLRNRRF